MSEFLKEIIKTTELRAAIEAYKTLFRLKIDIDYADLKNKILKKFEENHD